MKAKKFLFVLLNIVALVFVQIFLIGSFAQEVYISPFLRVLILCAAFALSYSASWLLWRISADKNIPRIYTKDMFILFFLLYVVLLVTMVLFDSYFGRTGDSFKFIWNSSDSTQYVAESLNLVPFKTVWCFIESLCSGAVTTETFLVNIAGNLLAFAPFAFFLPVLLKAQRRTVVFLLTIVCIVVAVEVSQLVLLTGFCDIDDLILNTGGAFLLYALLWRSPLCKLTKRFVKIV